MLATAEENVVCPNRCRRWYCRLAFGLERCSCSSRMHNICQSEATGELLASYTASEHTLARSVRWSSWFVLIETSHYKSVLDIMETFRGRKVIIPRIKDWTSTDETDKYSLKQRLSCKFGNNPTPIEVWKQHPEWSLNDLQKHTKMCNLYPFPLGMTVLNMFKPKRWLDPTAGWGDRLRCAIAYGCEYVGVDSNKEMKTAYQAIIKDKASNPDLFTVKIGKFQNVRLEGKFDLVFTSPPFFTKEVYEHMTDWKSTEDFMEEFLKPLFKKSFKHLEAGGHMVFYIEDKNSDDFIDLMKMFVETELSDLKYEGAFYYQGTSLRPYYVWKNNK